MDVARGFAKARTAMCFSATGVSQTVHGTLGEWLATVLNAVCGRLDAPGGRRFERGYVDTIRILEMVAPGSEHVSRLAQRPAIAGYHSLGELPDEILTPGPGQVRAMLLNAGNPVVTGPDGARLDEALATLELFVSFDLVQRESHRHAHWLIPGLHWLERDDINIAFGGIQEEPFVQFGAHAVDAPEGLKPEWEVMTDLCLAMGRNLFGKPGVNGFVRASRWLARRTGRASLAFGPHMVEAMLLRMGRRITAKQVRAHPHGWRFAQKRYGDLASAVRTDDGRVHLDVPIFIDEVRRLLDEAPPAAPPDRPFVLGNRRHKDQMNSHLVELPGLHTRRRHNVLEIHPDDAAALGISEGDRVMVSSDVARIELPATITDKVSPGLVATHHGWGSRVFDPTTGQATQVHGANRNLLIHGDHVDRFSQTSGLNDTFVSVERAEA